jgi:deoxyribose-phosphate aldolase
VTEPSTSELARISELAFKRPNASAKDIEDYCKHAIERGLYGVSVFSSRVELAASVLAETEIKIIASVGGFMGTTHSDVKRYEAEVAVDYGAQEIEVEINLGKLKDGDHKYVLRELRDVVEAVDERIVKVDLQTPYLKREEVLTACELVLDSGAHFISSRFADLDELKLCREAVGPKFGIRAMNSTPTKGDLLSQIQAGATRVGIYGHFFPIVD